MNTPRSALVVTLALAAFACSSANPPAAELDTPVTSSSSTSSSSSSSSSSSGDAIDSGAPDADAGDEPALYVPPASLCDPSMALGAATKVADPTKRLAAVTRDELTIAWTANGALYVADRGSVNEAFGTPQAVSSETDGQGVALGSDGNYLVAVGADHKSFLVFERETRADAFASTSDTTYTSLVDALDEGESIADPVFINGEEMALLYSIYGKSADTVRLATRISVFASFFPSTTFTFDELRAQGSLRRRPTGTGEDFQTIFYWDEVSQTEKLARLEGTERITSVQDLGAHPWAQANGDCAKVYFGADDLSFATVK